MKAPYEKINGFKCVLKKRKQKFNHYLGGKEWDLPKCKVCKNTMHQLVHLDLNDERLEGLKIANGNSVVLFSCLNCSMFWERQTFVLDFANKNAEIMKQEQKEIEILDEEDKLSNPLPLIPIALTPLKNEELPTTEESIDNIFENLGTNYIGRILGEPVLAQEELDNVCDICHNNMTFLGLISGSNEFEGSFNNLDLFFGEVILYFSLCTDCNILMVEPQSI
ncbi:hypothetical protein ACQ4LK_19575 [Bacillus pumilus]|uniref:hypothetical protein n=1 Tax=Bacillus pumilus TaxID=1408 RepID=UPI002281BE88|nr:hypothetical protein [Bacillus pumilus]MCY9671351.1 hypothetical protein [Bacillus pumilus]